MIRAVLIAAAFALAAPAFAQDPFGGADVPGSEMWQLDQLRIARDVPEAKLKPIEADHSLDAVTRTLTGLGIAYKRVHVRIAADRLPDELRARLLTLPPGEPFVIPEDDFWSISVITGRTLPPGSVRFAPTPRFALPQKA